MNGSTLLFEKREKTRIGEKKTFIYRVGETLYMLKRPSDRR